MLKSRACPVGSAVSKHSSSRTQYVTYDSSHVSVLTTPYVTNESPLFNPSQSRVCHIRIPAAQPFSQPRMSRTSPRSPTVLLGPYVTYDSTLLSHPPSPMCHVREPAVKPVSQSCMSRIKSRCSTGIPVPYVTYESTLFNLWE